MRGIFAGMRTFWIVVTACIGILVTRAQANPLRAGAAAVDVTPVKFPVTINGGFLSATADHANDKLHARCVVLDDGTTSLAICVVDTCVIPHELVNDVRARVAKASGIPADHIMISATHTHSAPALMPLLGVDADPNYPAYLADKLVDTIAKAKANLAPARWGSASVDVPELTNCRQWIYRPDRMLTDPFGEQTVRCNMHPGYQNTSTVGPSGPIDPQLSVLAFQTTDGKPLAVLANYSMHYFGADPVSADYFGKFCAQLEQKLSPKVDTGGAAPFVAIMSQGTAGDMHWMDYGRAKNQPSIDAYAEALVKKALDGYGNVEFKTDATLAMRERDLHLRVREPDEKRLAWAKDMMAKMGNRQPKSLPEVYAREAILLHEHATRDVKVAAIRIGDVGITTMSNEVFALTGLKIKKQSPLAKTFNIELANGEDGYIPPAELHPLGGYTTWPARSACLEVGAEAKISDTALALLEEVSGKSRIKPAESDGRYVSAMTAAKPLAYFRFEEMGGPTLFDRAGNHEAKMETGVLCNLDGPENAAFSGHNRALHFAGGRVTSEIKELGNAYSVDLWFWNGLSGEARPVAGYIFSRGNDADNSAAGDHLGIGGTALGQDRLIFYNGNKANQVLIGASPIATSVWNHVVLVRDGTHVAVYLNGNLEPEISGDARVTVPPDSHRIFLGGRNDNRFNLEGKLDEVAIFDRALTPTEATSRFPLTGLKAATKPQAPVAPRSPQETLASLRVKDGFEVQLVASEPLVMDPVAISFGPDGKLWIAEMSDYPIGVDDHGKAGGRIRYLEDTDGDGTYDKSTVLLDGVNFPNGIAAWRDGVLVTAAPEIFYVADTNHDGKPDVRESLYVGFTEGNTQLRVNGLKYGLDNWVYCANGWSSRDPVRSVKTLEQIAISGRDLRIRPDDGSLDAETGMTEYGRDRDDWGNWFGCNNSYPMWNFVLSDRYTRRNPYVAPPEPIVQLTDANPKVFPLTRGQKRYHSFEQAGHFTSACSTMVYRDDLLFPRDGTMHHFVCEPVHNVVQHRIDHEQGVTFSPAERAPGEEKSDFLASDDEWFRPVNLATGPDGALYVVDMYRYMVEHPEWLPPVGQAELKPFYRTGNDRGRIWRIVPKGQKPRPVVRLSQLSGPTLAAALDSSNGWQRDMTQELIVWRKDTAAGPKLEGLLSTSTNPLARLHALCTLDGLGMLKPELLAKAMSDEHPAVRRNAIRIAEPMAKQNASLIDAAAKLVDDLDAKVRLQLACSLGEWQDPRAGKALAQIAVKNADDVYISAAVMSSAVPHYAAIVDALLAQHAPTRGPLYRNLLAMGLALNNRDVLARLLEPTVTAAQGGAFSADHIEGWSTFVDLLDASNRTPAQLASTAPDDALAKLISKSTALADAARETAIDDTKDADARAAAAGLLGRDPKERDGDVAVLSGLLTPQTPPRVQRAAVRAIVGTQRDAKSAQSVLASWSGLSPEVRLATIDLLLGNETSALELLRQIEAGKIPAAEIDGPRRNRIEHAGSAAVKELASKVLGPKSDTARAKVVETFHPALSLTGDVERGQKLYLQNCAVCHRIGEKGNEIGPDLRSVRDWPAESILANVLDPNMKVEPRYLSYNATLGSGEVVFGVITSETGTSLTMKGLDGKETTVLRANVKSLECTNKSLISSTLGS